MDPLGALQPIAIKPLPAPVARSAGPILPQPSPAASALPGDVPQAGFDAGGAEQQRVETLQKIARDIANVYVVGDRRFTIFKDITGQYITRFTSLRDGRVTYIPEPELLKAGNSSAGATLNIKV